MFQVAKYTVKITWISKSDVLECPNEYGTCILIKSMFAEAQCHPLFDNNRWFTYQGLFCMVGIL